MSCIKGTIKADGTVHMEASGFQGSRCLESTRKYLEGLGTKPQTHLKQEYYEQARIEEQA